MKTSLFISLWILRYLPQQKIPRELGDGGDPAIFICSHVPIEFFLMGQITKIKKHKEERDRSGKLKKNKKEGMEEVKRRDFYVCGGSHTRVLSIGQERPGSTALV
jgi:hypothetical protein